MTIVKPCSKDANFSKEQTHEFKPARGGLKKLLQPGYISAPANTCPNCDKMGSYDAKKTRMIISNAREAGNMGNGYDMTDGYGKTLQPQYPWGAYPPLGYTTTSACGVTRISGPPQSYQQSGCCTVM
jgi:hypothetical protein